MVIRSIYFILFSTIASYATPILVLEKDIDSYTDFTIEYYEDTSLEPLNFNAIKEKKFQTLSNAFTFGYNLNNFWFRVRILNHTNTKREIYLELTEIIHQHVDLYTLTSDTTFSVEKNGLTIPVKDREIQVSNPTFSLQFEPHEEKEVYIRLSSIYTVFGAIHLKTPHTFFNDNTFKEKLYIFYFGAIIMIALYNLFIFFYLKEKIYFYYVSYVILFAIWSANYKGLLLPDTTKEIYDILQLSVPVFFSLLILFSQNVLETKKYFQKFHKVLNFYFLIAFIAIIWMSIDMHTGFYFINVVAAPLLPLLLLLSLWAIYKGHKIAKIYLTALSIYYVSMIILTLMALDILPYSVLASNAPIIGSFFEIFMLSLLLAYRINTLREETLISQEKLLKQELTEGIRLSNMVKKKTTELSTLNQKLAIELEAKKMLYQELNHRVKNNLHMIISLIELQMEEIESVKTNNELLITKNRIHSISHLYEYLHLNEQEGAADTLTHFKNIIQHVQPKEYDHVKVNYEIDYTLAGDTLLYAGLICNELATNAFKYAFDDKGTLTISLHKINDIITLMIKDNGPGFNIEENSSLGFTIVKTLVEDQLFGEIDINTDNGTLITITWQEWEEGEEYV